MTDNNSKVILLNAEGCGGQDANFGFEILVRLLESIAVRPDKPAAIVCWNTSVKLLTADSPVLSRFLKLENQGVKVFAGKLCVDQCELTGKIAAGKVASMDEILDYLLHYEVISL